MHLPKFPCHALAALLLGNACILAQSADSPTGTVRGHVVCTDTNRPARNARIVLQPVPTAETSAVKTKAELGSEGVQRIVESLPDGSFVIAGVKPGHYYVIAEKLGYLSPLASITREDLQHPTEASLALMARLLTPVSVVANTTSAVEVHLLPGATVAGTVRFDDGTPDAGARVELMSRDSKGKWTVFRTTQMGNAFSDTRTDDRGRYRFSGMPEGEYLVRSDLEVNETLANYIFGGQGSSSVNTLFTLHVFYGDGFRPKDAKPVKVGDSEDAEMVDILVPAGGLHAISGSLVESGTAHVVNAGKVAMVYPDDDTELADTKVAADDSAFHFSFVPEGTYKLQATKVRDVTREVIPYPAGTMPPTHTEEKTVKSYRDGSRDILVNGDESGVNITVTASRAPAPELE